MKIPEHRLIEEAQKPAPDYLDIPIEVESVVKGKSASSTAVRFYPNDAAYKPSNAAVLGLVGERAILFLTRVDEGPTGLYFSGHTPEALKKATDQSVAAAHVEASRQAQIVASWRTDTSLLHFAKVQALIARLGQVSGDQQQRVFDQLLELGKNAVPAIIAQMDVRRPLRTRAISLANHSPEAFEQVRHYAPEQVVDGLDAVLNQITGASFGSIQNGGSIRQRDATVAGWRVYAADLACENSN
jgi:hypothetical protein